MNRVWSTSLVLGVGLLTTTFGPPARAQNLVRMYELIELDVEGADQSRAYSVNDTGQVVGWIERDGKHQATHWHNRVSTNLQGTVHFELLHPYVLFNEGISEAFHISNADQVVGTAQTVIKCLEAQFPIKNAFLLRAAVLTDLATPYPGDALSNLMTFTNACVAHDSVATCISNANHVVGWADTGNDLVVPNYVIRAFLLRPTNGQFVQAGLDGGNDLMQDLGTLGASDPVSSATSVNDSGRVTGYSYTVVAGGRAAYHGFVVTPNDTNNDGLADQWFVDGGGGVNLLMADIGTLGGTNSWGRDINNAGDVVGESDVDSAAGEHFTRAFFWRAGQMTDLGSLRTDPATGFSSASSVNDAGVVVGWAENQNRSRRAFIYESGQMKDLNKLIYLRDETGRQIVPGIVLTEARDINADGVIVGWGEVKGSAGLTRGFLLNPILVDPASLVDPNTGVTLVNDVDNVTTSSTRDTSAYSGTPVFGAPTHTLGDSSTPDPNTVTPITPATGFCGFGSLMAVPGVALGLACYRRRIGWRRC